MFRKKLPKFEGKELNIAGKKHKVNFLRGDFGKAVLEEYKGKVRSDYGENSTLDVLSLYDKEVQGSNPFAAVLVNQIVRSSGLRIATLADLERILEQGTLNLDRSYNDAALVLRTQCGYNAKLSQHLAQQIKARDGKIEYPVMVPLASLELDDPNSDASKSSDYRLAFNLREDGEVIYAPQFLNENSGQSFSNGDQNGLPILGSGGGNRTLYTTQFGLVRAYLHSDRGVYSNNDHLRDSSEYGRVVLSAAGAR